MPISPSEEAPPAQAVQAAREQGALAALGGIEERARGLDVAAGEHLQHFDQAILAAAESLHRRRARELRDEPDQLIEHRARRRLLDPLGRSRARGHALTLEPADETGRERARRDRLRDVVVHPAARLFSRSPAIACAVIAMMGSLAPIGSARICCVAW